MIYFHSRPVAAAAPPIDETTNSDENLGEAKVGEVASAEDVAPAGMPSWFSGIASGIIALFPGQGGVAVEEAAEDFEKKIKSGATPEVEDEKKVKAARNQATEKPDEERLVAKEKAKVKAPIKEEMDAEEDRKKAERDAEAKRKEKIREAERAEAAKKAKEAADTKRREAKEAEAAKKAKEAGDTTFVCFLGAVAALIVWYLYAHYSAKRAAEKEERRMWIEFERRRRNQDLARLNIGYQNNYAQNWGVGNMIQ